MSEVVLTPLVLVAVVVPSFWGLTAATLAAPASVLAAVAGVCVVAGLGLAWLAAYPFGVDPVLGLLALLFLAAATVLTVAALVRWRGTTRARLVGAGALTLAIAVLPFMNWI